MSKLSPRAGWRRAVGQGGSLAVACLALPAAAAGATWSEPALLSRCANAAAPAVVFPSADPHTSSGPGAILWSGGAATCAPARPGIGLAAIGTDDAAGPAQALRLAPGTSAVLGPLAGAPATGDGRIVIAAGLGGAPSGSAAFVQGRAGGSFGRPAGLGALTAPLASATSYLGDIALATVNNRSGVVELRLEHHGTPRLSRPVMLTGRRGTVSSLAVGLDYRGDALVVWAQDGFIFRRVLRASGRLESAERIAATPPAPHLEALISDDNRGIVAWTAEVRDGASTISRVYLDTSASGIHFGRPRLLEQFRNAPGVRLPEGSLRLVRLASEGVIMAWTGMSGGRYVVRAASVSIFGKRPSAVISGTSGDAVLDDLATGPHAEALALWSAAPRLSAGFDVRREQILAARGVVEPPGLAVFSRPEVVAPAGPNAVPRAAFDPATDNAVAVWQSPGAGIAYSTRRPGPARRSGGPAAHVTAARDRSPAYTWGIGAALAIGIAAGLARIRLGRRSRSARRTLRLGRAPQDG